MCFARTVCANAPSNINQGRNILFSKPFNSQVNDSENNSNEMTEQSTHILSHIPSGNNLQMKGESPKVLSLRYVDGQRYHVKCP